MHRALRRYLPSALLACLLFLLAGSVPAAAGTAPAPLAIPGQALAVLARALPVLGPWLAPSAPSLSPQGQEPRGDRIDTVGDRQPEDQGYLPAPDDAPSRDGGGGPWGDEASGPWPRS